MYWDPESAIGVARDNGATLGSRGSPLPKAATGGLGSYLPPFRCPLNSLVRLVLASEAQKVSIVAWPYLCR